MTRLALALVLLLAPCLVHGSASAGTLDTIRARGTIACGVGESFE